MKKKLCFTILVLFAVALAGSATVTSQNTSAAFTCSGSSGPYPFTFPISEASAITVLQNGAVLAPSAYTVTPVNNNYGNGGSIVLNTGCPNGQTLVLQRMTPLTQASVFTDNMPVPMKTMERALDKVTEIDQDLLGELSGNLTLNLLNSNNIWTGTNIMPITDSGGQVYNVRTFGADPTGVADSTTAIQAAINAAGLTGGIVFWPPGIYKANGSLQTSCDGVLCLPKATSKGLTIRLSGVGRARQSWTDQISGLHSVITTTTAGVDSSSAVIGVTSGGGYLDLYVNDLTVATFPNPSLGCINAGYASGAAINEFRCETNETSGATSITQPTNQVTGVILPGSGNDGLAEFRNSIVSGYYTALQASEHANFDHSYLLMGIVGLNLVAGPHTVNGELGIQECATPVVFSGAITVDMDLDFELDPNNHYGCASWCYSTTDISDASNYGSGIIRYEQVIAGSGTTNQTIRLNGATGIDFEGLYTNRYISGASSSMSLAKLIPTAWTPNLSGTGACTTGSLTGAVGSIWWGWAYGGTVVGAVKCTGSTGASNLTVTPGLTNPPNGWMCSGSDATAGVIGASYAASTSSCSLKFSSVTANDWVQFAATPY